MATIAQELQDTLTQPVDVAVPETTDTAPTLPAETELTLEEIIGSETLMSLGAQPGDVVRNGELIRNFSTDADAKPLGKRITAEEFLLNPTLRQRGAEVGDRITEDGTIEKASYNSGVTQFRYGWNKGEGLINMGSDVLEAVAPLGTFGQSTAERYGEEFDGAAFKRRLELINQAEQRDIAKSMGYNFLSEVNRRGGGTGMSVLGEITGELAGGDILFPARMLGAGAKGLAISGSTLGATYSIADDFTEGKSIDLEKATGYALGGAALSQLFPLAGKGISAVGKAAATRGAKSELNSIQNQINKMAAEGAPTEEINSELSRLGKRIQNVENMTGGKITVPASKSQAEQRLADTIAHDSTMGRRISKGLDQFLGTLSTRIRKYSEPIFGRMRKFEGDSHIATHMALKEVDFWAENMQRLPKATQRSIGFHLSSENFKAAKALMPKQLADAFDNTVVPLLKRFKDDLKAQGDEFVDIPNYFPRMVRDYKGLKSAMGQPLRSRIEEALEKIAASRKIPRSDLSETEVNRVMERMLRGYTPVVSKGKKLKYVKDRTVALDDNLYKFYEDPSVALSDYIRKSVHDMETRKFFGTSKVVDDQGLNTQASIAQLAKDEMKDLTFDEQDELMGLLTARFTGGEQTPHEVLRFLRNTGYMGTIANPLSAIVQLGDLAVSGALHGVGNTFKAMFGRNHPMFVKLDEVGIGQLISEELSDPNKTSRLLRTLFRRSGFTAIDRFAKETSMNAALAKSFKLAKGSAGEAALRKKWGNVFGKETDALIADLKADRVTENVKLLAFNELSDLQPITLLEMPEKYLTSPNGRIFYMLKSFMLKQIDVARRNIFQEAKTNPIQALKTAGALWGYLAVANGSTGIARDMILMRDIKAEDIPERAMWGLLGVYGVNQYTSDRYFSNGNVKEGFMNMIIPATPIIDAFFESMDKGIDIAAGRKDFEDINFGKYLKPVPIVGNIFYNWFFGGAEEWNEDKESKRRSAERQEMKDMMREEWGIKVK
jgi:hypothetical protein